MAEAPSKEHLLQFFAIDQVAEELRPIAQPYAEQAARLMQLPRNPERTVALRKLLESRDAALRAVVFKAA